MSSRARVRALVVAALGTAGCGHGDASSSALPQGTLSKQELLDPATCGACHPTHTDQWRRSMHAYASDDPVFVAMNARAQRESGVGDFCVNCHAPMALRLGLTTDGTNLADLPSYARGVTCYFCHEAQAVTDTHNAPVVLADDATMRGGIADPAAAPHLSAYSKLHDREIIDSAPLCGSCHDIVTPEGAAVATTFEEWKGTLYGHDVTGMRLTCSSCHMNGTTGKAATTDASPATRTVHDHSFPAIDVPLTDVPGADQLKRDVVAALNGSLVVKLCVTPPKDGWNVEVTLDNAFVGHAFPSGASYDRRVWVEVTASKNGAPIFASGAIADGMSPTAPPADPSSFWLFYESLESSDGEPVPFQWQAARAMASFLPPAVTNDPTDPAYYHAVVRDYLVPVDADTVSMRVRVQAIDAALAADLVASGDLDPKIAQAIPTYTVGGTELTWTSDRGFGCVP